MDNKKWFKDAKYGLMIHWGLYSILAGEYNGRRWDSSEANGTKEDLSEWIMSRYQIPVAEYEKLTKAFNPIYFDAEEWVLTAKAAGMKYIVITAKHHEGFALFKSDVDKFNVVDSTPFGRDIIGELAQACKKHNLKLGLYYSQELDWHEPHGGGYTRLMDGRNCAWTNCWDFPDNDKKDFSICFEKKTKPQVRELLTKYGDICLIWFDTPLVISAEQSKELYDLVKSLQSNCLVNSRIGNGMGDYTSGSDKKIPDEYKQELFEAPCTLNDTWGYKSFDNNWKSAEQVAKNKKHLNERGINYLLNIGPDHLGRFPVPAINILKKAAELDGKL